MIFRKSTEADLSQIEEIALQAKALLKADGVSQWQKGTYPDRERFCLDVQEGIGYVAEEEGEILAVCAVTFSEEAAYGNLSGNWLTEEASYATIHRSAVSARCASRHISSYLFDSVAALAKEQGCISIRVDTHPDNLRMQKALRRAGYEKCGELTLISGPEAGDLRYGFEILL